MPIYYPRTRKHHNQVTKTQSRHQLKFDDEELVDRTAKRLVAQGRVWRHAYGELTDNAEAQEGCIVLEVGVTAQVNCPEVGEARQHLNALQHVAA